MSTKEIRLFVPDEVHDYFKNVSKEIGLPMRTIIALYLKTVADEKKKLKLEVFK